MLHVPGSRVPVVPIFACGWVHKGDTTSSRRQIIKHGDLHRENGGFNGDLMVNTGG